MGGRGSGKKKGGPLRQRGGPSGSSKNSTCLAQVHARKREKIWKEKGKGVNRLTGKEPLSVRLGGGLRNMRPTHKESAHGGKGDNQSPWTMARCRSKNSRTTCGGERPKGKKA